MDNKTTEREEKSEWLRFASSDELPEEEIQLGLSIPLRQAQTVFFATYKTRAAELR